MQGEYFDAKKDLSKALKLIPNDPQVTKLLKKAKAQIKKYKNKQKKLYGNMFKTPKKSPKQVEKEKQAAAVEAVCLFFLNDVFCVFMQFYLL